MAARKVGSRRTFLVGLRLGALGAGFPLLMAVGEWGWAGFPAGEPARKAWHFLLGGIVAAAVATLGYWFYHGRQTRRARCNGRAATPAGRV